MSQDITLSLIDRDEEQPRQHFDDGKIAELAQSMDAQGLIIPILVRPAGDRFVLVHGERRWRAAQSLSWETIPAEVRELDASEARWLVLIENIQREDLSPLEEARAYKAHLASGITQTALGQRIGKSQSYIAQKLRLLKLSEDVQSALATGDITEGHARQLLRLKNSEVESQLSRKAVAEKWTVAWTRAAVDVCSMPGLPPSFWGEAMELERLKEQAEIETDLLPSKEDISGTESVRELASISNRALRVQNMGAELHLRANRMVGNLMRDMQQDEGCKRVHRALCKIRDEHLYREQYPTFAEYCTQRWEMTPEVFAIVDEAFGSTMVEL